jgi:hypothetical protein
MRDWFDDAFSRYLPAPIRNTATAERNSLLNEKTEPQQIGYVADGKHSVSNGNHKDVAGVADDNPELWEDLP